MTSYKFNLLIGWNYSIYTVGHMVLNLTDDNHPSWIWQWLKGHLQLRFCYQAFGNCIDGAPLYQNNNFTENCIISLSFYSSLYCWQNILACGCKPPWKWSEAHLQLRSYHQAFGNCISVGPTVLKQKLYWKLHNLIIILLFTILSTKYFGMWE